DTEAEVELVRSECEKHGVNVALSEVWAKGGQGGLELAEEVIRLCDQTFKPPLGFVYEDDTTLSEKIEAVAKRIYHADGVDFVGPAVKQLSQLEENGFGKLPVCIAKTQYSFSDNPKLIGAPKNFRITVRNLKASAGAGFVVALTGEVMTMPGLPKVPSAEKIDVDESGRISGLF
ncbi:MAG: formate--tetrahydrofolate ligase, partial [Clostridiaceae bacterium]|nr:formate--tetrahydrofolate ligase [Clostridiaceae bacterium]